MEITQGDWVRYSKYSDGNVLEFLKAISSKNTIQILTQIKNSNYLDNDFHSLLCCYRQFNFNDYYSHHQSFPCFLNYDLQKNNNNN